MERNKDHHVEFAEELVNTAETRSDFPQKLVQSRSRNRQSRKAKRSERERRIDLGRNRREKSSRRKMPKDSLIKPHDMKE